MPPPGTLTGRIEIDGSSTVFPITEAVAEEFQKRYPGVKVTVGISGTGGGFKRFTAGETDISNASRPITTREMDAAKQNNIEWIELPVAFDGLTVVVNPRNNWVDCITVAELKKIWEPAAQGVITRWNQVNPKWPDFPLQLFGAGTDSGTFDYFTEAIVGRARSSRGDYTASEDDNVLVQGVSGSRFALGYFGLAYYEENKDKLKALAVDGGRGCVFPTMETVMTGQYQPLSRPLFIYVSLKSTQRPEVDAFVRFYLQEAPKLVRQVGYIPLPPRAYELALNRFIQRKTGSIFAGGAQVGVRIEDILARE
ncbi:MAG: PstS family phosphate ABC transporter substrate-binding protein [Dehalococcoidia bacterium]|nr:PstS family phosphate ABC transporter substrate-binding protein [Dehalococcoidia bacterium]